MLTLRGVSKGFGEIRAVDDLSLEIRPGEVFGLLGPNGAGKTTTIHMAIGLLHPDAGEVDLSGRGSPVAPAVRRHIGLAPQSLALYDDLSGEENLRLFGEIYGMGRRELTGRVRELLELVGLSERAGSRAKGYSGGMKRRLNLAAALVHDPDLVMLDEPTAGVDPQSRSSIFDLVRAMRDAGKTIIYTTHYMEEAQRLCDRVAIIDRGRVLALDTVEGLIETHGGRSVVIADMPGGEQRVETDDPVGRVRAFMDEGDPLSLRIDRPDLESVFLSLTGRSLRD